MRATLSTTLRIYLLGAIWMFVTIGILAVVVGPMGSVYALIGLSDPLVRTLGTMAFAITAATLVAGLLRRRSGRARRSDRQPAASRTAGSQVGTATLDVTL
jgi:hypothetical protein